MKYWDLLNVHLRHTRIYLDAFGLTLQSPNAPRLRYRVSTNMLRAAPAEKMGGYSFP